ncbi:hypothetical protein QJ856_gp0517 [Tupanvirus deep ocean]|uniref:Uncharacterized protein n=2 Tax=Tupanvirus TaxID=2094720 RepID=A0AC62A8Y4_9VIRU|nr:hypothetical protein QJ856_gp0517 [Tupanvirus deep ocean]QKU34229.1 hypothetical protein [Tupanvirus deep ocean]
MLSLINCLTLLYILGSKTFKMNLLIYKYKMFHSLLITAYLILHQYYSIIWKILFSWIGNFIFIYHVNNKKVKNITLNYYLGYKLHKFQTGKYYAKIYNCDGTNHVAFDGHINQIHKMKIHKSIDNPPKRKKILLLNNEKPLNIDLEILDNYKINMKHSGDSSITNLAEILEIFGLQCTHVTIIEFSPFRKITKEITEVDVNELYVDF